jgi:WD40 repeat protein
VSLHFISSFSMHSYFLCLLQHHGGSIGPGAAQVQFAWQPRGNFLATVGKNSVVHVWDRHGERIEDGDIMLKGQGRVLSLEWDSSGETLAILQEGNGVVELWDIKTRSSTALDTNLKDPSFLKWSVGGPELAIGTNKGNLLLYNADTRRKVPVLGKHARKITCGAWSSRGKLALGSEDRFMTISDRDGNTEDQKELKNVSVYAVSQLPVFVGMCFDKLYDGGLITVLKYSNICMHLFRWRLRCALHRAKGEAKEKNPAPKLISV